MQIEVKNYMFFCDLGYYANIVLWHWIITVIINGLWLLKMV